MNDQPSLDRRNFIATTGALLAGCAPIPRLHPEDRPSDINLTIRPTVADLGGGVSYPTFAYNDQVPGPVIRLSRGRSTSIQVRNYLQTRELVHWHGLRSPSTIDGAEEEGTPSILPFATSRFVLTPNIGGTHWYHTHMIGAKELMFGAYSGLFGVVVVDDDIPVHYDAEVVVAMHHFGSHWIPGIQRYPNDRAHGYDIAVKHGTINGRLFGHGEPIRVRQNSRVLFRFVNASATELTWTALAGHAMNVVALDGVPVPRPQHVETLMLGPGERADVIVYMDNPGRWILGAVKDNERQKGFATIVEYAGTSGEAKWTPCKPAWSFRNFASDGAIALPDHQIPIRLGRIPGGPDGYNMWTFNEKMWPDTDRNRLEHGKRYRLTFINETDQAHPMHLHRHHFELASYDGESCPGVFKDTLNIRPRTTTSVDFVADNPGPTLLHCHHAAHQDSGMMALMLYKGDNEPIFDPTAMRSEIEAAYCGPARTAAKA